MFFQIEYGTGFSSLETDVAFVELSDAAVAEDFAEELVLELVDSCINDHSGEYLFTKDNCYDNAWYNIKEITIDEFNQATDDFGGDYHRT